MIWGLVKELVINYFKPAKPFSVCTTQLYGEIMQMVEKSIEEYKKTVDEYVDIDVNEKAYSRHGFLTEEMDKKSIEQRHYKNACANLKIFNYYNKHYPNRFIPHFVIGYGYRNNIQILESSECRGFNVPLSIIKKIDDFKLYKLYKSKDSNKSIYSLIPYKEIIYQTIKKKFKIKRRKDSPIDGLPVKSSKKEENYFNNYPSVIIKHQGFMLNKVEDDTEKIFVYMVPEGYLVIADMHSAQYEERKAKLEILTQ